MAWRIARERVSSARLRHLEGTAQAALQLAPMFGADPQKALAAAILHDIARDLSGADLVRMARTKGIIVRTIDVMCPVLLHGKVGAAIAEDEGVADRSVLDAISWHVTGRAGWTSLEQVVYLADKIEESRVYAGVHEIRALVRAGKPRTALLQVLRNTIKYALDNEPFFVDPETVVVFNEVSQGLSQTPEQ